MDRGVPLRTLLAHTDLEILAWGKIVERYNILKNGRELEQMVNSGHQISGEDALFYNRYLEENEKVHHALTADNPALQDSLQ
ncbi:MAG: hypothetical protein WCK39_00990 [Methanomassiliicoccales archaeon]